MTNGKCDDCGRVIRIGEWPYDCGGKGHELLIRLAIMPGGRTKEYGPPMPINPMKREVTRDWMNPDGTMRPMKEDEWQRKDAVPGLQS